MIDSQMYHSLNLTDLVDVKCDNCNTIYQKTKQSWYYSAYIRGVGINFDQKNFCCRKCNNDYIFKTKRKNYNCLQCNTEFVGIISQNPKFCNHSCAAIFNNSKRDRRKFVNCELCSIEFSVWKSLNQTHYKCDCCKKLKTKKEKSEKAIIKYKNCKNCTTIFVSKRGAKYCSLECIKENRKKYFYTCEHCKLEYKSTEKVSKFCSNSCRSKKLKLHVYAHKAGGLSRSKIELYLENRLLADFPNINIIFNDKETIDSELDILIPDLKMAIEINGILHYEPIYGEDKLIRIQNKDKQKMINCYEKGIELIVIPLGKKGVTKKKMEEIYDYISNLIQRNKGRMCVR